MDDITQAPKVAATHAKNGLSKIPKPVFGIAAVGVVGFVWYKKTHNTVQTASATDANATPVADQGSTSQAYTPNGGSISDPYGGYGNTGNYNTGLPLDSPSSGSSDTTVQAQLGDVSQLIGTLFPGGLPLGSGTVSNPLPGQGSSTPAAAPAAGVITVPPPATPAPAVPTYVAPAPAPVAATPAKVGTVTSRGPILKITKEKGKTCHYYANNVKECF